MADQYIDIHYDPKTGQLVLTPDRLNTRHKNNVIWRSHYDKDCDISNITPATPQLFDLTTIRVPANQTSQPVAVLPDPGTGQHLPYNYSCVSTASGLRIDPVIIVDPPTGGMGDDRGQKGG